MTSAPKKILTPPGGHFRGIPGVRGQRSPGAAPGWEDHDPSKIPLPSPGPFRRSSSMRLRGEKTFSAGRASSAGCSPNTPNGPWPPHAGGFFPSITESKESSRASSVKDDGPLRNGDLKNRQRSLSLSLSQSSSHLGKSGKTPVKSPSHLKALPTHYPRFSNNMNMGPVTPPVSPEDMTDIQMDDDLDSLHSYSSVATTASCDHAYVARNGTTFSGRKMKYVVHCSTHAGQTGEEYLTPTQRAQRQIRRLKALLSQAKLDLEKKDIDIFRLTKEVVELRLYKASLTSPEEKSNSSDAVTVKENTGDEIQTPDSPNLADLTDDGPIKSCSDYKDNLDFKNNQLPSCSLNLSDLNSSLADSGHFEDLTNSSVHSKDSIGAPLQDRACGTDRIDKDEERRKLIYLYEQKIEDITRRQCDENQEMKKLYNDRVEAILQKLADVNSRYSEIMPDYEQAKERIRELEKQLEEVSRQLAEQEDKHHKVYLQMYTKGQEAAKFEQANQVLELSHASPSRVSVPELLKELQITQMELDNIRDISYSPERLSSKSQILLSAKEAISLWILGARKAMYKRIVDAQTGSKRSIDPEVTLQFLKSAIYYFLTDRENHQGHLNAIESILGFSESEKQNIQRARLA